MKKTKVAIVTRTRNRKILLRRALESVIGQTYGDWGLVIVNDGGGREHVDPLVEEYRARLDGRAEVLHHETSKGMEAASNAGLRASDSEHVIIHDDDDSWHPDFLAETTGYLQANQDRKMLGGVVAQSIVIRESIEGDAVVKRSEEPFNTWMKSVTLYRMAAGNFFPPISFLYKRAALDQVGYYREDLPVLGDWDFHLRFLGHYDIGVVTKPLAYYHHRMELMNGEYANTIIGGEDTHKYYDAMMRNELLRKDLANGVFGLGFMVNLSNSSEDVARSVQATSSHLAGSVHAHSEHVLGELRHFGGMIHPTLFGYVKDRVYKLIKG